METTICGWSHLSRNQTRYYRMHIVSFSQTKKEIRYIKFKDYSLCRTRNIKVVVTSSSITRISWWEKA